MTSSPARCHSSQQQVLTYPHGGNLALSMRLFLFNTDRSSSPVVPSLVSAPQATPHGLTSCREPAARLHNGVHAHSMNAIVNADHWH